MAEEVLVVELMQVGEGEVMEVGGGDEVLILIVEEGWGGGGDRGMQVGEVLAEEAMQGMVPSGDHCGRGGRSRGHTA